MRIFVADNHDVLRRGLRSLFSLQPGWVVCGDAKNGKDAVQLILQLKPDIVILDQDLPEINGVEATRLIRNVLHDTEILFFTSCEEDHIVSEALKAGARGYVLKSDSEDKLVAAVETLGKHLPFFGTRVSEMLLKHLLNRAVEPDETQTLTAREREIVQLLTDGSSNKEAAAHFGVSVKTIEARRSAIMRKLGLSSISDLVRYAIRTRLIQP